MDDVTVSVRGRWISFRGCAAAYVQTLHKASHLFSSQSSAVILYVSTAKQNVSFLGVLVIM